MKEQCLDSGRIVGDDGMDRKRERKKEPECSCGPGLAVTNRNGSQLAFVSACFSSHTDEAWTRVQRGTCLLARGRLSHGINIGLFFLLPLILTAES